MNVIAKEFENYFVSSMKKELPVLEDRLRRLRVSSFPYCGLKDAYNRLIDHKETHVSSGMEFYTGTGTTAHTVFQRWLGCSERIYGAWKCRSKKCNPKNKITVEFGNSSVCPKCKGEMEYEEFTVKYGKNLTGHLDGVYKDSNGKYWVIDYKTSSVRMIRRHDQEPDPIFPYTKNRVQILSYCALIENHFDIKIEGWILLYVARDNPAICRAVSGVASSKQKARILKTIGRYDVQYSRVSELKSWDDILWLIEEKPCKTREQYEQFYAGFKGCPLHAVCFTSELKRTMKLEFKEGIQFLQNCKDPSDKTH